MAGERPQLKLERAEFTAQGGRVGIRLWLRFRGVLLECNPPTEQKRLDWGWAFLGPEWQDRLEPVTVTIHGIPLQLRGCTNDPAVLDVLGRFYAAMADNSFAPGPISL